LTALGVDPAGNKEVIALRACAEEDKEGWACLLQDVRSRGATQIDLIVTDGHDGLLAAVSVVMVVKRSWPYSSMPVWMFLPGSFP
jgi:transposase-like protein